MKCIGQYELNSLSKYFSQLFFFFSHWRLSKLSDWADCLVISGKVLSEFVVVAVAVAGLNDKNI